MWEASKNILRALWSDFGCQFQLVDICIRLIWSEESIRNRMELQLARKCRSSSDSRVSPVDSHSLVTSSGGGTALGRAVDGASSVAVRIGPYHSEKMMPRLGYTTYVNYWCRKSINNGMEENYVLTAYSSMEGRWWCLLEMGTVPDNPAQHKCQL